MQLPSKFQIGDMVAHTTRAAIAGADAISHFRVAAVVFEADGPRYRLQRKMPDQRSGVVDRRKRNLGAGFQDASGGFGMRTYSENDLQHAAADPAA